MKESSISDSWYEVTGVCSEVIHPNSNRVVVAQDDHAYLFVDKNYGLYQWGAGYNVDKAKFNSVTQAIAAASHNVGKPWYFKPYKFIVHRITQTTYVTEVNVEEYDYAE